MWRVEEKQRGCWDKEKMLWIVYKLDEAASFAINNQIHREIWVTNEVDHSSKREGKEKWEIVGKNLTKRIKKIIYFRQKIIIKS